MDSVQEKRTQILTGSKWEFDRPNWPTSGGSRGKGRNDCRRKMHPDDGIDVTRPVVAQSTQHAYQSTEDMLLV